MTNQLDSIDNNYISFFLFTLLIFNRCTVAPGAPDSSFDSAEEDDACQLGGHFSRVLINRLVDTLITRDQLIYYYYYFLIRTAFSSFERKSDRQYGHPSRVFRF